MTAWLSILVPLLVMFFALGMERLEARLRASTTSPGQDELDDFLGRARPDEVKALFRSGTGRALELFRLRNRDQREGERAADPGPASDRAGRPQRIAS